jgi:hypothetical protein
LFELEREFKDTSKHRFDLENECRALESELNRENEDNYNNKMTIVKDKEFEDLLNKRFTLEMHLQEELIKAKDKEIADFKAARAQVTVQFESNVDL